MTESPNFSWCTGCPLPEIMQRISQARNGAQIANGNAVSSDSPTQAQPYLSEAKSKTAVLRGGMDDLNKFIRSGKKCQSCTL